MPQVRPMLWINIRLLTSFQHHHSALRRSVSVMSEETLEFTPSSMPTTLRKSPIRFRFALGPRRLANMMAL